MMRDHAMQIPCDHAAALVPSYLDGELSEAQAAPLRAHLLGCVACREVAKEGKALKRWFVAGGAPAVPAGFAARVARRAFAGDPGGADEARTPAVPAREAALLPFVLRLTVAAAAVLLFLAAAMQLQSRPTESDELRADDLDLVWEEIYGLEARPPAEGLPTPPDPERMRPDTRELRPATGTEPARR
jgi:anti-sigma factor RsiW